MAMPVSMTMEVSSIYIALCGILLILLAGAVVRGRLKYQVGIGDGGDKNFSRTVRVHANATEYLPIALLLLVTVENTGASSVLVHTLGSVLVVSRLFHAAGLGKSAGTTAPRVLGTLGTWLVILSSAVIVLFQAF